MPSGTIGSAPRHMRLVSLRRETEYLSAVPAQVDVNACLGEGNVALRLTLERQRVPMLDASTLEDRTRPALYRLAAARLRYFWSPASRIDHDRAPDNQVVLSAAKLGRR